MIVQVNLNKCIEHNADPLLVCLLSEIHFAGNFTRQLYEPDWLTTAESNGYLLSINPYILSEKALDLIGVYGEFITANEFIDIFPHKVMSDIGYRPIRPLSKDTQTYKELEELYLKKVTTKHQHLELCKKATIYVKNEMHKNKGYYIPVLKTIILENRWDYWNTDDIDLKRDLEYGEPV